MKFSAAFLVKTSILAAVLVLSAPDTQEAFADAVSDWQKAVVRKVAAKQVYPRMAVAQQIEGKAKVKLTVTADGTISHFEIVESTGQDVLDKSIPKLVERLSPLPALPNGQTELSFLLPLNWSLD